MTLTPRCRRGFTLVEMSVASACMAVLALVISSAWYGVGRTATDLVVRSQLLQEIDMAVATLSRDLGGSPANTEGRLGGKKQARLVGLRTISGQLQLCFDGGSTPDGQPQWGSPDAVIIYQLVADALVRADASTSTSFTVARNVDTMTITADDTFIRIQLNFKFHDLTRTCTLIARLP
jgi:prepilin-type N-terminal cleavage/methylation domain-containing protein